MATPTYTELGAWIGASVEIPVHYDLWMRGAFTGTVVGRRKGKPGLSACLVVRMNHPQVKRLCKVWAHDVPYMKKV